MGEALPYVRKTKRRPSVTRRARIAAITCAVVATGLTFGCLYLNQQETIAANAAEAAEYTPAPVSAATVEESMTFAAVGDSITEADSPDIGAGETAPGSWVDYAQNHQTDFVGGWADAGATTAVIAANTPALQADRLVILAGTNDVSQGVEFQESAADLIEITAKSGVGKVIVSAIPPFDRNPSAAGAYNEQLAALADARGWTFVDPMGGIRDGDTYKAGMTADGVHPTQEAARIIGENLRAAILG